MTGREIIDSALRVASAGAEFAASLELLFRRLEQSLKEPERGGGPGKKRRRSPPIRSVPDPPNPPSETDCERARSALARKGFTIGGKS